MGFAVAAAVASTAVTTAAGSIVAVAAAGRARAAVVSATCVAVRSSPRELKRMVHSVQNRDEKTKRVSGTSSLGRCRRARHVRACRRAAYVVFESSDELLVARHDVRVVLTRQLSAERCSGGSPSSLTI
ncbi:hypothetical protein DFH11DRAFT_1669024 [Phellopilus nigrolimitatus]|nr:hypothetical protein DFH11DRAFT_1669024 [Phellopilus nigrolimitatus]